MSNEWKMVPVDPTEEMVYAIATRAHCGDSGKDIWSEALAYAPVPPAGDVEAQRYDMSGYGDGMIEVVDGAFVYFDDHRAHVTRLTAEQHQLIADCWQACGGNGPSNRDDLLAALRLMNEAEDELTAERDGLLAKNKALQKQLGERWADIDIHLGHLEEYSASEAALQSDLTKARERNQKLESVLSECRYNFQHNKTQTQLISIIDALFAHQSAPAAKGGELEDSGDE